MKIKTFALFVVIPLFGLIGPASADWFAYAITITSPISEQTGSISLGALMVALAVLGRTRFKWSTA